MKIIFMVLLSGFLANAAIAAGFTAGDKFVATVLEGWITVNCSGAGNSIPRRFSCRANALDPAEESYFSGPVGGKAARVALEATHADGSTVQKNERYNPSTGRSEAVNLWISTLLQRPLLDYGANRIAYSLLDAQGHSLEAGEFAVSVAEGPDRQCPDHYYFSSNAADCNAPENLCDRYFADENYCQ